MDRSLKSKLSNVDYIEWHGIIILLAQKSSQLALSCRHCVTQYTGEPWLENQMSASQPLDFLRTWYNNSAGAEFKPAGAVLP